MSQENLLAKFNAVDIKDEPNQSANNITASGVRLSLDDEKDRVRILEDMARDLRAIKQNTLRAMFWHVDNVRCLYHKYNREPPAWYVQKYGHLFHLLK